MNCIQEGSASNFIGNVQNRFMKQVLLKYSSVHSTSLALRMSFHSLGLALPLAPGAGPGSSRDPGPDPDPLARDAGPDLSPAALELEPDPEPPRRGLGVSLPVVLGVGVQTSLCVLAVRLSPTKETWKSKSSNPIRQI